MTLTQWPWYDYQRLWWSLLNIFSGSGFIFLHTNDCLFITIYFEWSHLSLILKEWSSFMIHVVDAIWVLRSAWQPSKNVFRFMMTSFHHDCIGLSNGRLCSDWDNVGVIYKETNEVLRLIYWCPLSDILNSRFALHTNIYW